MTDNNHSDQPASGNNKNTSPASNQTDPDGTPDTGSPSREADATNSSEEWEDPNEESGSGGCLKVLVGCAGAAGILIIVVAVVIYFSWGYLTNRLYNQATKMVKSRIEQSELSKDDKKKLKERVDQIKTRFQNNDISVDQVREVAKKAQPLLLASTVQAVKQAHIPQTDWSEQEKKDANRALDRFIRGLSEQKISNKEFNTVIQPVLASGDAKNTTKLKENPSDKNLKKVVQRARKHADKHNIPDESYNFDAIERFDEIIKNTLHKNGTGESRE